MWRAIGLSIGAAATGSFVSTYVGALFLTLGRLFDDPFLPGASVIFSLITMFFTVPGSLVVLVLTRRFERQGASGARLGGRVVMIGALLGGAMLTLLALAIYALSRGNSLYLDIRVSLIGAFYGAVTAVALWGLRGAFGTTGNDGRSA